MSECMKTIDFWILLVISGTSLMMSIASISMLRTTMRYVLQFDPHYQQQIDNIHAQLIESAAKLQTDAEKAAEQLKQLALLTAEEIKKRNHQHET